MGLFLINARKMRQLNCPQICVVLIVYGMDVDNKSKWSCLWNSEENCIQNSARVIFCLSCAVISFLF